MTRAEVATAPALAPASARRAAASGWLYDSVRVATRPPRTRSRVRRRNPWCSNSRSAAAMRASLSGKIAARALTPMRLPAGSDWMWVPRPMASRDMSRCWESRLEMIE